MEQNEKFCRNYTRQWVPIQKIQIDQKKKRVTAKGLWVTNSAKYINRRSGCVLEGDAI
jgi:hypothetical protein